MIFAFDIISDLNLGPDDDFDWNGKPTSLFCLIPGNISVDPGIVRKTLKHLSTMYQGVFYIDGSVEHIDPRMKSMIFEDLTTACEGVKNVVYLHNNVVIVEGTAIVGINGWYKNYESLSTADEFDIRANCYEDIAYLDKTIEKLQIHNDVKSIVVISSSVPSDELYYGEAPGPKEEIQPVHASLRDTEHKIKHWVFGTYNKLVDTTINDIHFVNNGRFGQDPYYPKRIELDI